MSALNNQTNQNPGTSYFFTKQELQTVLQDLSTLNLGFVLENPKFSTVQVNAAGSLNGSGGASITGFSNYQGLGSIQVSGNIQGSNVLTNGNVVAGGTVTALNATVTSGTLTAPKAAIQQLTTISSINGVKFPISNLNSSQFLNLQGSLPSTVQGSNNATIMSTIPLAGGPGVYGINFILQPYFLSTGNQSLVLQTQNGVFGNGGDRYTVAPPGLNATGGFPVDMTASGFFTTASNSVTLSYIWPSPGNQALFRGLAGCNNGAPFFNATIYKLSS